ncbi:M4 family metallopeptidase [Hyphomicrobium sp. CS1GBMeth3]|uniref:M4 family metallopeptidase n=1 Tax=Hyphomicrobium sp. CS1GBMeth3 TaxID=1892845 RepID=UPI000930A42B|nr:M4 family metallopeptidase [Hyphomicrobium sp. CS1GBMeth3]
MMPRHTPAIAAAVLFALAPPLTSVAQAQLPPSQYDRLQRTLEDKFAPKPAPPKPSRSTGSGTGGGQKDDFIFVDPKGDKTTTTPTPKRSDASWSESISTFITSALKRTPAPPTTEPAGAFSGAATEADLFARIKERRRERRRARMGKGPHDRAGKPVPVAKPNSFVIQLSPNATESDIEALLKKYNLTITKMIAPLGVITVEQADPARQRSVQPTPAAAAQDSKAQLQNVLEPPIIRELREEKIVDGAFVNSTMEAKQLRKTTGAAITVDDEVFAWRWNAGDSLDGNWGLKAIRLPPVWTILDRHRQANPSVTRPKIAVIDSGFATHPMVPFASVENVKPRIFHTPGCGTHHGMHVAGIIGAAAGSQPGIDGIIPDARMDAIAVDDAIVGDSGIVGVDEGWQVHALLFDDVLAKTLDYVYANLITPDNLRVINISLGYNFVASNLLGDDEPEEVPGLALHIMHQANLIRLMASRVQDHVLFVVAAGNDSDDRESPIAAKWASPFAWAGTQPSAAGDSPTNILVVEAVDRDGLRAEFSNTGGHVSAPGVDIMSTLAADKLPLGVCSGTSQAAPHVAALAGILFELAPDKSPAEIAEVLRASAHAPGGTTGQAPTVDALEAVAAVAPEQMKLLGDLDGDGTVDASDLAIFARQLETLKAAATANAAFTEDLNGDGVIDDNECFWPRIDLNGSGHGTLSATDARRVRGADKTDLAAMELFWSETATPFPIASAYAGLSTPAEVIAASDVAPAPIRQCRGLAPGVINVADGAGAQPSGASGSGAGQPRSPIAATTASGTEAGSTRAEVQRAVEELRKTHPNLRVTINPATGMPGSVMGISPQPGAGAPSIGASGASREQTEEETKRAVEAFFGSGGLGSLYPARNKGAKPEYVRRRKDPDLPNRYVADVEQRVDGVPVFGSTAKLSVDSVLGVTKFSGTVSSVSIDDTTPKIAEGEAIAAARLKLGDVLRSSPDASRAFPLAPNPDKAEVGKPSLVVFDPALIGKAPSGKTRLAWLISIDSFRIFVDAVTGEAFYYYRDQPSGGMLRRIYDLGQATTFPGTLGIDEEKRQRADKLEVEALIAFRNAGIVRDYFFLNFGRDGFDDNEGEGGSPMEAYVRHGRTQNAYWCMSKSYDCPKGNVMVYGPGYAGALDIVAHEMTHGIIAHEKNLLYLNEPGAVNESLADIFGALIELDARGDAGNWLIGEASPGFSVTVPLRSLADPNLRDTNGRSMFDRAARFSLSNRGQPDHYSEVLTPDDAMCGSTAYNDNGCVHFNSGILNKFAYLISEGGTHRGATVTGIGRAKLARITYRAMTVGLNQSSTLSHAANAFVESCYELASGEIAGITLPNCDQVVAAQRAVGLEVPSS